MPRRHQLKTPVQQEHDAGLLGHVNMCPLGILILTLNAANNTVKKKTRENYNYVFKQFCGVHLGVYFHPPTSDRKAVVFVNDFCVYKN